jgi:hypothetical protein
MISIGFNAFGRPVNLSLGLKGLDCPPQNG